MLNHKQYKFFVGAASIIILIAGLVVGVSLASNLGTIDLQVVNIGLTFASIILLLIIGGLMFEIKDMLGSKKFRKR